ATEAFSSKPLWRQYELRRTYEGCGEIACTACGKRQIKGSEGFHPDRHACQARGFIDKGRWARALRHRHTTAGYEGCGGWHFSCARWAGVNSGREGRAGREGRPAGGGKSVKRCRGGGSTWGRGS